MARVAAEPGGMRAGEPLVIGLDGGGSRCAAVLARPTAAGGIEVLGRGRGGPANPLATGTAATGASVAAAVAEAYAAAGLERRPAAAACLGLAGVGRPAQRGPVEDWAVAAGLAAEVVVMTDAEVILAGSEPAWGVAVIAGTGSLAWGRSSSGAEARCGGWGPLMGDEGSGYAIAVAAVRAVARMHDGRGPPTDLLPRITDRFGVTDAPGLVTALSQPDLSRRELAAAAVDVVAAAAAGDAVASAILAAAGADLAAQVVAVARRLGLPAGGYPLRMTGGVAVHAAGLRAGVTAALDAAGLPPAALSLVDEPAVAAARVAAGMWAVRGPR